MSISGLIWFIVGTLTMTVGTYVWYKLLMRFATPWDPTPADKMFAIWLAFVAAFITLILLVAVYSVFMMMVFPGSME